MVQIDGSDKVWALHFGYTRLSANSTEFVVNSEVLLCGSGGVYDHCLCADGRFILVLGTTTLPHTLSRGKDRRIFGCRLTVISTELFGAGQSCDLEQCAFPPVCADDRRLRKKKHTADNASWCKAIDRRSQWLLASLK